MCSGALARPRCSVIIPAYNAADFILRAVESALGQEPDKPQVIVVDDGSQDETAKLVAGLSGVKLIRQTNAGIGGARSAGLREADGDFLVFLDADDELLPGAISAHLDAMENAPQAAMVFGANYRIDEAGRRIGTFAQPEFETSDPHFVALRVTPAPSQCMYRRTAFDAVGGYDATLRICEDSDLNIRITRVGSVVSHGAFVLNYRMHEGQSTKRPSKICHAHLRVIRKHLGVGGTFEDQAALSASIKKWKRYYGQFIPNEIIRAALRRDLSGGAFGMREFVACLPYSAIGAASHLRGRVIAAARARD